MIMVIQTDGLFNIMHFDFPKVTLVHFLYFFKLTSKEIVA